MYLSRATWLPIDCCFNEWASTMKKQTSCKATSSSSPPNVTCCDDNTNKQNSNIAYSMKMLESYFSYFHYLQWLCFFSLQIVANTIYILVYKISEFISYVKCVCKYFGDLFFFIHRVYIEILTFQGKQLVEFFWKNETF